MGAKCFLIIYEKKTTQDQITVVSKFYFPAAFFSFAYKIKLIVKIIIPKRLSNCMQCLNANNLKFNYLCKYNMQRKPLLWEDKGDYASICFEICF